MSGNASSIVWAMCPPEYFRVEYVINPWMEGHIGSVKNTEAKQQWQNLYDTISRYVSVELIPPVPQLPDMTFVANAGFVLDDIFIPSQFLCPQRQPEEKYFIDWFTQKNYQIRRLPKNSYFEGQGDVLAQPDTDILWAGYGMRSSLESHLYLADVLPKEIVSLRLVNQRFYHLDTCFAPLPGGRVVYYPAAFDLISLEKLQNRIPLTHRLEVSELDAMNFTCNGAVYQDKYICHQPTPEFSKKMRLWGFEVIATPLSEFMLAGGAAKCLTLTL